MIVVDVSEKEHCIGLQKSNSIYTYLLWFDGVGNYGYTGQIGSPLEEYEFCFPISPNALVEWSS